MAEPIRFKTSDGKEYVLEFNRRTVTLAEKEGLNLDSIGDKLMTTLPDLFYFAFKMHHAFIKKEETDRILFEEFHGLTEDELKRLVELYTAPYESLINGEGDEKNLRKVTIL